ncbi:transglycosylase domain-containing protein [Actinocorallia lasiicapitis]
MSFPPYGPDNGPSGNLPDDDWFRPAPNAGEEIFRESEYGRPQQPQSSFSQEPPYSADPYAQNAYSQDGYGGYDDAPGWGDDENARAPQPAYAQGSPALSPHYVDEGAPPTTLDAMRGEGPIDFPAQGTSPGADGPGGPGGGAGGGKKKREGWKRYIPNWKIVSGVVALMVVSSVTLVAVGYMTTPTPDLDSSYAKEGVTDQSSDVYWDKAGPNSAPLFQIGLPRENVAIKRVPLHVQQAVMAAEEQDFETDGGISYRGLTRAVVNTASGKQVQGGSTITQQLARNYLATLSTDQSMTRKFKEIFTAIKLNDKYSKDFILETYLNTIPFGRQTSGIQAASKSYFHKNIDKVTVSEGAMLAAMIQQPGRFCTQCPKTSSDYKALVYRWGYVLDNMVEKKWLTPEQRAQQKFPKTYRSIVWTTKDQSDQTAYIRERVNAELAAMGINAEEAATGGYKIYTSLDPKLMEYARTAVLQNQPVQAKSRKSKIRAGLTVVNPENGEIVAFYGGDPKRGKNGQSDAALVDRPQMGSSFKPYVLATALEQDFNIKSLIEGRANICLNKETADVMKASGRESCEGAGGYWVSNRGHGSGSAITLKSAMTHSVNSSFIRLSYKVGRDKVENLAGKMMGFSPERTKEEFADSPTATTFALGVANIRGAVMRQAAGYSTFANGGYAVMPHIIKKVTYVRNNERKEVTLPWKVGKERPQVLTADQAAQATEAMRSVVTSGTGIGASLGSRPAAGKTGTTDDGVALWFTGFTPQYSAAAAVFTSNSKPDAVLKNEFGGGPPAKIWKAFMLSALEGKEVKQFPTPDYTGQTQKWDTPKPTKTTPTCAAEQQDLEGKCPKPGDGNGNGNEQKRGCLQFEPPNPFCDPTIPPSTNPVPDWFCEQNPGSPYCADPNGNGDGNGNGNGQPQPGDANGDGVPDNPNDVDGDGVPNNMDPDYKPGNGNPGPGNGNGNGGPQNNGTRLPASWVTPTRTD